MIVNVRLVMQVTDILNLYLNLVCVYFPTQKDNWKHHWTIVTRGRVNQATIAQWIQRHLLSTTTTFLILFEQ